MRRAQAIGAELIIAECHHGGRTRPWLIHLTDWELLRTSPVPVLLLKKRQALPPAADAGGRRPRACARQAREPRHAHPGCRARAQQAPARRAARHARQLPVDRRTGRGRPVHSDLVDAHFRGAQGAGTPGLREIPREHAACRARARTWSKAIRRRRSRGSPASWAPASWSWARCRARAWSACSSATPPSGFSARCNCDVLVVKPAAFAARVARDPRGIRVQAPSTPLVC